MDNIFITGATGFLGENLTKELIKKGYNIHILARRNSCFLKDVNVLYYSYDINELITYFSTNQIGIVIHLASCSIIEYDSNQVSELIDSNLKLGTHLLEAMKICGIQYFINTNSAWQHAIYDSPNYHPNSLYAATKEAYEKIIQYYVEVWNVIAVSLTLFDTYGLNDKRNKIISLLYKTHKEKQPLLMTEGLQEIGLIHISDVVNAYVQTIENIKHQKGYAGYTLNPNRILSIRELVSVIESITMEKLHIVWGAKPYRKKEIMNIWQYGENMPYWQAKVQLEQGLQEIFLL